MIDLDFIPRFFKNSIKNDIFEKEICDEILYEINPLLRLLTKFNE